MDRFAILRRSAVLGIDPVNQNYLFQFQEAYSSAWRQHKRRQRQRRSSSLKADSHAAGIDALAYGMMNMDSLRGFSRGTADGGPNVTSSERPRTGTGR